MSLIGLLVVLLVFCAVVWAARTLLAAFGIGNPVAAVVWVVIVLIAVAWVVQALSGGGLVIGGPIRIR